MTEKRDESLTETAEREMETKGPVEAMKDDVSKLVHGEDIKSSEPSEARKEKHSDK